MASSLSARRRANFWRAAGVARMGANVAAWR
jgi:hypothetical protein